MTTSDGPALELGEGFAEDEVVVLVDGRQVWHRTGVTTNYSVGLADIVRLPIGPSHRVTVEVRVRGSSDSAPLQASAGAEEAGLRAVLRPEGVRLSPATPGDVF